MTSNHLYREFYCWHQDEQSETHAQSCEAMRADWAAERFAADYYASDPEGLSEGFVINVRDEAGVLRTFAIFLDFSPTFTANEVTPC